MVEDVSDCEQRGPDRGAPGNPSEQRERDVFPGSGLRNAGFTSDLRPARTKRPHLPVEIDQDGAIGLRTEERGRTQQTVVTATVSEAQRAC